MYYKRSYIYLTLFFMLSLTGCSFIDSVTENTTIDIIQPISNYRDTRQIGDQPYLETALSVLVKSNKRVGEVIPVNVTWNGSAPVICYVIVNDQTGNTPTPCGQLPMYKDKTGQQTVKVEVEKLNGKIISDSVVFVWEPLAGFDIAFLKVAQLLGSQNPTMGMIFLIVAALVIFSGIVAVRTKSIFGVIVVFITGAIGVVLVYSYFNPALGVNIFTALLGFLSASFIFALIAYAVNRNYGFSVGGSKEVYGYDEFNRPKKSIEKGGLIDAGPRHPQLPEPPPHYRVLPPASHQSQNYPQIPSQYQNYLPPPTEAEEEFTQVQERPRGGLFRLFSAMIGMNKKKYH